MVITHALFRRHQGSGVLQVQLLRRLVQALHHALRHGRRLRDGSDGDVAVVGADQEEEAPGGEGERDQHLLRPAQGGRGLGSDSDRHGAATGDSTQGAARCGC